jgi:iron complex outermembrane receptor protein
MSKSVIRTLLTSSALVALALLTANTAAAQAAAPAAQAKADSELAEVLVTARKRDESIVDVPLAISVVSDVQMQKLDIRGTGDLAKYVPGLEFNDFTQGNSRNDRGHQRPLIFRGMNLGLAGNVTAAGGMFLDGAAVVGNEVPGGLDIGSVEILRGPQSVYFGRSSMTGAVSYRTKEIPSEWGVTLNAKAAQRSDQSVEASIAGRVFDDKLGIRVTGLTESSQGYIFNNYDGSWLGSRSRHSLSATLHFQPTDKIDVKLYSNKFFDQDGPAATAMLNTPISLSGPNSCQFTLDPAVQAPFNTTFIKKTICGEIPKYEGNPNRIDYQQTAVPTQFANTIFSSPLLWGAGFRPIPGLQRGVVNSHLVANFKLNDSLTLEWISGYHTNVTTNASDGINAPPLSTYQYYQYFYTLSGKTHDISHEVRLTSDTTKKFSFTVGTNYVDAWNQTNAVLGFGNQRTGASAGNPNGLPLNPTTYSPVLSQAVTTFYAKTNGVFAGGYLKLLDDKMTVSAEARYQRDKRTDKAQSTTLAPINGPFEATFNSFSPRISVDYDVGNKHKIYGSFATGNRPGGFNSGLASRLDPTSPIYNATAAAQITQLMGFSLSDLAFKEEKLSILEAGFKGYLDDGKGYFDVNVYYGKLKNQQVGNGTLIPALGFTVTATNNVGETEMKGLEFQGNYNFTHELNLAGTLSWNNAVRTQYLNTAGVQQFGTTNFNGKKMALAPEYTGSAILSWERPGSEKAFGYFANGALVYRGKMYMDSYNASWIPGRAQLDARVGISRDKYRVEAFMLNVFDDRSYTGGNIATDFGGSGDAAGYYAARGYAFFGAIAPPRQVGVRLSASF